MSAAATEVKPAAVKSGVKPSDCGTYFIWAVADPRTHHILVCATTKTRAAAAAQADIWQAEWENSGDQAAATARVTAVRRKRTDRDPLDRMTSPIF